MIEIKEITKSYGTTKNPFQVLKGISLEINDGDFTVILGASGSGKSTFLNIISGLEYPDSGSIIYNQNDITKLSDKDLTEFRKNNIGFFFSSIFYYQI